MMSPELASKLKASAAVIDRAMRRDLAEGVDPSLSQVLEYALFSGGKRVRPLLCLIAGSLSGPPRQDLDRLALVFEYLHVASLLHDDVIDRAETRRGRPTANRTFGVTAVILAGDFLHARALQIAGLLGGEEVLASVSRAVAAMINAEFLQMRAAEEKDRSEATYFSVLAGKTGALIAAACETGILAASGSREEADLLRRFGEALGLAFQIVDDLLDYQGDPRATGKAVGNDLAEGKMTLPLLQGLALADAEGKRFLESMIEGDPACRAASFGRVQEILEGSGAFAATRKAAQRLVDEALTLLRPFPENEARATLEALARYVLSRDR